MTGGQDLEALETSPPVRLDEGYYLDNFLAVLDTVEDRDHDLLSADERAFSNDFRALDLSAQRLYVRLISRRGPYFRRDRLAYDEIPDLDGALDSLRRHDLLDHGQDVPVGDLLALLLRPEIQELAEGLIEKPPAKSSRKDVLVEALLDTVAPSLLETEIRRRIDILCPRRQEILLVYRLLYFGNLGQDWTEFVLRDLGVVRYEAYEVRRELRRFDSRQAIDDSLRIRALHHAIHGLMAEGNLEASLELTQQVIASDPPWHGVTERRRQSVLLTVARQLERCNALDEALSLYGRVSRPPARERRARVLERQQRFDEAIELCEEMGKAPREESEAVFAPRFGHQLRRKRGEQLPPWRRPKRPKRTLQLVRRSDISVEQQALLALNGQGTEGFFSENWLWKSLFGLAFWDIIFAPVAGAFQHAFQYGPLDLHSRDFRIQRQDLIARRLEELRQASDLSRRLLDVYDVKHNTANRWVSWHKGSRQVLQQALDRLEGPHLATISDRLSRHPGRYRRGFPDLFVWSTTTPGFQLLEVKAPGDQLRPEQGAWIDYLNAAGIETQILHLKWSP